LLLLQCHPERPTTHVVGGAAPAPITAMRTVSVCRVLCAVALSMAFVRGTDAMQGTAVEPRNVFGIGAYYPPGIGQIATARDLVGPGGWILILVPAGTRDQHAPLSSKRARVLHLVQAVSEQHSHTAPPPPPTHTRQAT
jgi:hypothetical protein